jgi:hypothetical protein
VLAPEMTVEGIRREAVNGCSSSGSGGVVLVGEGDLDLELGFGCVTKRETRKSHFWSHAIMHILTSYEASIGISRRKL